MDCQSSVLEILIFSVLKKSGFYDFKQKIGAILAILAILALYLGSVYA